ncbi:MAG: glycoside hydrolase family 15 protein, partial [Rhodospirillales bacterium]|nr:glycoside hydrolase family 15 protein [Acetobacter sp.]
METDHTKPRPRKSHPGRTSNRKSHPDEAAIPDGAAGRIEDYALIGDCHTAALVSLSGSIDWLCWPRFDSPACFAAILGTPDHGRWRICPATEYRVTRRYWPGTMILETLFETKEGSAAVIDFMAVEKASLIRIVEGRSGSVPMTCDLALRFEYGSAIPWVTRLNHGSGIRAVAGPDQVVLQSDVKLHGRAMTTVADWHTKAGHRTRFVMTHAASHLPLPTLPDADHALDEADAAWTGWSGRCTYRGTYREIVHRSLLTLKALSYYPTGGIVAAPTTSLPEALGGSRNWDYRFCWVRDATFTLLALLHAGYKEEAQAWGAWLRRSVAGTPAQVQTLYGLAGERLVQEWEVPWLPGYQGSK